MRPLFSLKGLASKRSGPALKTFVNAAIDHDALNVSSISGMSDSTQIPVWGVETDSQKILSYRNIAINPYVSQAITEIKNESFVFNEHNKRAFLIDFYDSENSPIGEKTREKIVETVNELYHKINFEDNGLVWFENFYVDSKVIFHVIVDKENEKGGVQDVVMLDPLKVRKVKFIPKADKDGVVDLNAVKEVYVYTNESYTGDFTQVQLEGDIYPSSVMLSDDAVIEVTSGKRDAKNNKTIGWLETAVIPHNNLKMMEESMLIFRIVRAPMRRAFYLDVSKVPPTKAEAHMKQFRDNMKIDVNYNRQTGTVNGDSHVLGILHDYFIPRSGGDKTTEIQTIDGQSDQSILDEVEYCKDQLLSSLHVPKSRFVPESNFDFGKGTSIQRDEYRFNKFVNQLRNRFMIFFDELLKRQLILRGIIKPDEWTMVRQSYFWIFTEDNLFAEWKTAERINNQLEMLDRLGDKLGTFYSREWVWENICRFTESEKQAIKQQIEDEASQAPEPDDSQY